MNLALKVHSYYSILQSPSRITDIVDRAYDLKLDYLALTDISSLSGIPEIFQLIEKKNEKSEHKIKPIAGICLKTEKFNTIYLLAKNKLGWSNLVKLLSEVRCTSKNLVDLDTLSKYSTNLICISDNKYEELEGLYESMSVSSDNPSYYVHPSSKLYHQILICSYNKITLDEAKNIKDNVSISRFFEDTDFSLKYQSFSNIDFLKTIETYSLFDKPKIPTYIDNNNNKIKDADEYLTQLCREGWKRLEIASKSKIDNILDVYTQRIKEELSVIKMAGIANYFLLVKDFVSFCRIGNKSAGLRGSAVGSLIFYLLGVTDIDPVKPDPAQNYDPDKSLLFSRFINKGRFTGGRFALPDADIDVHPSFRNKLKDYIKQKYGDKNVCDIVTFSKMKGAKTIKEVFRVLGLSFELANQITDHMLDEAKVQDDLEDLREDNPKYNIINYCIDHIPQVKSFADDLPYEFDIAINLTDTITNESKHAAGIVVSNEEISSFIPVTVGDDGNYIGLFKMQDIEYVGGVKMDILGVLAYEKLDAMIELINKGVLIENSKG